MHDGGGSFGGGHGGSFGGGHHGSGHSGHHSGTSPGGRGHDRQDAAGYVDGGRLDRGRRRRTSPAFIALRVAFLGAFVLIAVEIIRHGH